MTSSIQTIVMQRVRTIHAIRSYALAAMGSLVVLAGTLWGLGREVWVARVFQNAPPWTNSLAAIRFYIVAFLDTRHIVQVLCLLGATAFIWFGYTILRQTRIATNYRFA